MKNLKKFLQFSLILAVASLFAVSCASDQQGTTTTADASETAVEESTDDFATRSLSKKVESKAYYYKSLAKFAKGEAKMDLANLADLQGKQVNFVVLYESMAPWAEVFNTGKFNKTGDDTLNGLMDSYELDIVKQFAIDDENEGFVLEPNNILDNAVETARELSMVDHVLMVHVKEVPTDETVTETAANN